MARRPFHFHANNLLFHSSPSSFEGSVTAKRESERDRLNQKLAQKTLKAFCSVSPFYRLGLYSTWRSARTCELWKRVHKCTRRGRSQSVTCRRRKLMLINLCTLRLLLRTSPFASQAKVASQYWLRTMKGFQLFYTELNADSARG